MSMMKTGGERIVARAAGVWLLGLGLAVLAAGCSPAPVGRVAGKVTLNGQPLSQGSVVFQNEAGTISVNAGLGSDGSYEVRTYDKPGLPPGTYRVAVTSRTFGSGDTPLVAGPPTATAPPASAIPAKYQDVKTSGLSATVKAGSNPAFDFNLSP